VVAASVLAVGLADAIVAGRLLGAGVQRCIEAVGAGVPPFGDGRTVVRVTRRSTDKPAPPQRWTAVLARDDRGWQIEFNDGEKRYGVAGRDAVRIWSSRGGVQFAGDSGDLVHARAARLELSGALHKALAPARLTVFLPLLPRIAGWSRDPASRWRIGMVGGEVVIDAQRRLRRVTFRPPGDRDEWSVAIDPAAGPEAPDTMSCPNLREVRVETVEMDRALAEVLRIAALQVTPVRTPPDGLSREGQGWLLVRHGRRAVHLEGTAYEIGLQHGRLLKESVRRMTDRTLRGVGLVYSLEKGEWFPDAARALVERQRAFIAPEYFEEMRGLADGAGIPVDEVAAANIFPEFFHCSGAALFGRATADGSLLHARVLDYMTGVGLQDEAAVFAIRRKGVAAMVNVGYAGMIGCVTGMNEQRVAIGEMGGRGEGLWDGTPMAFLMRGALEHCESLDAVLAYMRGRPRTCEYYYVVSDGKVPDAAGVKATPDLFEVIRPGTVHPQLPDAVDDAVLMSAGSRYRHLVERVRAGYGRLDARGLFELVRRPVAMGSNLHNVVFEPRHLRLWVADATRHAPACDQEPVVWTWKDLFPERPPPPIGHPNADATGIPGGD
jgi:hypothetical protein